MKDLFEDHIKNRMEEAAPEALGYRPDREALWSRIAAGRPARRPLPFRNWVTHAAAIAAGFLLALVLLQDDPQKTAAPERAQATVAAQGPVPETAAPPAKRSPAAVAAHRKPVAVHRPQPGPLQRQEPVNEAQPAPPEPVFQAPQDQPAATVAAAPAPKQLPVLHLNELDNENAPRQEQERRHAGFIDRLAIYNPGPGHSETVSVLVGKAIRNKN